MVTSPPRGQAKVRLCAAEIAQPCEEEVKRMGHYKSNVRDLEFNLFEVLDLDKALSTSQFGDLTAETVRDWLYEAARQAEGPLAQPYADADRRPPTFDPTTHSVQLSASFKAAVRFWRDSGWLQIGIDEVLGGVRVPEPVKWAISEFLVGGHPAAFFYLVGPELLDVLYHIGNEQQQRWAGLGVQRNWGATMVLTEPDAGSDVGAARTRASDQGDGTWHIHGIKRFITSGDSDDLFENIAHMVLARPDGAPAGTKGLSLFLVPKFLPDPITGEPGARNGVFATGLEHKMGLTASATCELSFGQHGVPAVGWLVGDTHNGIAQMFQILEYARMMIGVKSIATLSTGYLNALEFAKTRIQGADMAHMSDTAAPRVPIIRHPDVRRSLMTQKAYAEGLRALYLYTVAHHDHVVAELISGTDEDLARRIHALLLPVVKGVSSERAYQCLTESLQNFGGSGYLQDYPIEQYIRDAKVDSLYEGTTGIQAQDFVFRKIIRDQGTALNSVLNRVEDFVYSPSARIELTGSRRLLAKGLADVREMADVLIDYFSRTRHDEREVYRIGLVSVPFLFAFGDFLIGWLLLVQAEVALNALDDPTVDRDRTFYRGKVAVADFFAQTVIPRLSTDRRIIDEMDISIMDLSESAF